MRRLLKTLLKTRGIIFTLMLVLSLFVCIAFYGTSTEPSYTKKDLAENYEQKKEEILEAKRYFESIMPENAFVHIEFDNNKELEIFHVEAKRPFESNLFLAVNL